MNRLIAIWKLTNDKSAGRINLSGRDWNGKRGPGQVKRNVYVEKINRDNTVEAGRDLPFAVKGTGQRPTIITKATSTPTTWPEQ